jgi:hypothetical protein
MGLFSWLFGGKKSVPEEKTSVPEEKKIVSEFGAFLESNQPTPGTVADASKLPFPKDVIKESLVKCIKAEKDPQMKEVFQSAYIMLADWQEGVGETNVGLDVTNFDPTLSSDDDMKKLANQIISQSKGFDKWKKIVAAEQAQLMKDLDTM